MGCHPLQQEKVATPYDWITGQVAAVHILTHLSWRFRKERTFNGSEMEIFQQSKLIGKKGSPASFNGWHDFEHGIPEGRFPPHPFQPFAAPRRLTRSSELGGIQQGLQPTDLWFCHQIGPDGKRGGGGGPGNLDFRGKAFARISIRPETLFLQDLVAKPEPMASAGSVPEASSHKAGQHSEE